MATDQSGTQQSSHNSDDDGRSEALDKMTTNLARVEELSQRLVQALSSKNPANPTLNGPSQDLFAKAASSLWSEALENPGRMYENQLEYWGKSVRHFMEAQQMMLSGGAPDAETAANPPSPTDKRFSNPLWSTNPYFSYIRQQYQLNAEAIAHAVAEVDDLEPKEQRRLR